MHLFVEVGRKESFTQAAKSLGIPLSTLARRIASLETRIGLQLIERTTRSQHLTTHGRRYFERCEQAVDDALAAHDELLGHVHGIAGVVHLALDADLGGTTVGRAVAAFCAAHPDAGVRLSDNAGSNVSTEPADLLLRIGDPAGANLIVRKIGAIDLRLYAAPSYLDRRSAIATRAALRDQQLLLSPLARSHCPALLRDHPESNLNGGGRLVGASLAMIAALAVAGEGIATLPDDIAGPLVSTGQLRPVLKGWSPGTLPIIGVTTSRLLPLAVRTLITFLGRGFADAEALGATLSEMIAPPVDMRRVSRHGLEFVQA